MERSMSRIINWKLLAMLPLLSGTALLAYIATSISLGLLLVAASIFITIMWSITSNPAKTLVTSVCSFHCNKARFLALKKDEIERIFLQSLLHVLVVKALARFPSLGDIRLVLIGASENSCTE